MKQLTFLLVLTVLLISCSSPIKELEIDNPSDKSISITFDDDESYTIEPHGNKKVETQYGQRSISINGAEPIALNLNPDNNYLLNPSSADYYLEYIVYASSEKGMENYNRDYGSPKSKIYPSGIDSMFVETIGDYQSYKNKLLISSAWQYGPSEESPVSGNMTKDSPAGYVIMKKMHRADELFSKLGLQAMNQGFEEFMKEKGIK